MHTKLFRLLRDFICGVRTKPVDVMSTGFYSLHPQNQPSLNEWMKEFKFGCRYGHRGSYYQK